MKKLFYLCLLAIFMITSCQNEQTPFMKKSFDDGSFKYLLSEGDSIIIEMGFNKSGGLSYFINYPMGNKQAVYFEENSGVIESKLKLDSLDQVQGLGYYFNSDNGNLSSVYSFSNGKKIGEAFSYHDSIPLIQSIMLYNEGGLYYRKSFDEYGNHVSTEGSKE